jgi:hypothetical protein
MTSFGDVVLDEEATTQPFARTHVLLQEPTLNNTVPAIMKLVLRTYMNDILITTNCITENMLKAYDCQTLTLRKRIMS